MSDLISREALKKALKSNCDLCHDKNTNWCEHCCPQNDFEDLIDNAPSVEGFTKEDMTGAYNEGYACGSRENERTQGEWIVHSCYKDVIICSNCNSGDNRWHKDFKFCPNCGAKMKGGAE